MAGERNAQQMALEYRTLQERAAELQRQISTFKALLDDAQAAAKALGAISEAKPGQEILFPLGSGAMVKAKPTDTSKVLAEVGAGVVLEKTPKEAIEMMLDKETRLTQAIAAVEAEIDRLGERAEQLRAALMQAGK